MPYISQHVVYRIHDNKRQRHTSHTTPRRLRRCSTRSSSKTSTAKTEELVKDVGSEDSSCSNPDVPVDVIFCPDTPHSNYAKKNRITGATRSSTPSCHSSTSTAVQDFTCCNRMRTRLCVISCIRTLAKINTMHI